MDTIQQKVLEYSAELIGQGYTKERAEHIAKKIVEHELELEYEDKKKVLTGQYIDPKQTNLKKKSFAKYIRKEAENKG